MTPKGEGKMIKHWGLAENLIHCENEVLRGAFHRWTAVPSEDDFVVFGLVDWEDLETAWDEAYPLDPAIEREAAVVRGGLDALGLEEVRFDVFADENGAMWSLTVRCKRTGRR